MNLVLSIQLPETLLLLGRVVRTTTEYNGESRDGTPFDVEIKYINKRIVFVKSNGTRWASDEGRDFQYYVRGLMVGLGYEFNQINLEQTS